MGFVEEMNSIEIIENTPLADFSYPQIGGIADYLVFPKTIDELIFTINAAKKAQLPITVFGRMSNLVIVDSGIRGAVIVLSKIDEIIIDYKNNRISAQAGADIIRVAELAYENGLSGLEWASGIPGSVGGALYMNAGAYGGQTSDVVFSATFLDENLEIKTLSNRDLDFGYRQSLFQNDLLIILSAEFSLVPKEKMIIRRSMDEFNQRRAMKQPLQYPSNGSVFKRPTGYFAGKLIMDSGLQGYQFGGAQVSKKHAGFIVNVNNAKGNDYLRVIEHVQETVFKKFGVHLETEVKIIEENSQGEKFK